MTTIDIDNEPEGFRIELVVSDGNYSITITGYDRNKEKMVIPESFAGISVTAIHSHAFMGNKNLRSVIIPEGLTTIGFSAFAGCYNLVYIRLPQSLITIESSAFQNCKKLKRISFPEGLIDIGDNIFYGCKNLQEIDVDEDNPVYASEDGVLFDKHRTTLIAYPKGKERAYKIPDSVIDIEHRAFEACEELTQIIISQNLLSLTHKSRFYGCKHLSDIIVSKNNPVFTDIDGVLFNKEKTELIQYPQGKINDNYIVPDTVTRIGAGAFYQSKLLYNITLPEGIKFIGDYAFGECEQLTAIYLPQSLQYIGKCAFGGCAHLTTIKLSRKTKMGYKAFEGFQGNWLIYRD